MDNKKLMLLFNIGKNKGKRKRKLIHKEYENTKLSQQIKNVYDIN